MWTVLVREDVYDYIHLIYLYILTMSNPILSIPCSLSAGQCFSIPQARHAGQVSAQRRDNAGDQGHESHLSAAGQR